MLCLRRWIWSSMLTCRELQVEVFWCPGQKATICFGAYSVAIFMAVGSWAGGLWSCAYQPYQPRPNVRCISTLPGHSHHGSSADFICARSLVQIENHAALLLELASAVIWADSNASRLIDVKDNIVTYIYIVAINFHWHEEQLVPILKSTFWNTIFFIMCFIEAVPVWQ